LAPAVTTSIRSCGRGKLQIAHYENGVFSLDWASLGDALFPAAFFAIVAALYQIVTTSGFNLFDAHWLVIGKNMANIGFRAA
jgi:hypothetical protein